ncbi:MAG: ABC transporter ATP-binding protein, partial [Bacteroidetes bacterium]|nr:ABC transporter ATP-binding protein [Bacteroidota bacterium]
MKPIIQIEEITKKFDALTAVDNISLEIRKGEIIGLLGPNGAGKTTLINMICGLLDATSGEIFFQHNKNKKETRAEIGICPQENIYWPKLRCKEQLIFMGEMYGMSLKKAKERSQKLLDLLGLSEKSNTLAKNISGGMKRRLSICLALIHDPEILILDEPEAGLDPQSRILVRNFIKSLTRNKTIVLTTHNMDEADRMSDRVAIMNKGKLLMTDTPDNLKRSIGEGDVLEIIVDKDILERSVDLLESFSKKFDDV